MASDDAYTKALLHFNGSDESTTFTDESGKTWTPAGSAQLDTTEKKFGTASGLFNGTTDYITAADSDDWDFGTGDWTVDCWCYPTANKTYNILASSRIGAGQATNFFIYLQCAWAGAGGYIAAAVRDVDDNDLEILTTTNYSINTWQHISLVRDSNTMRLFKDGVQIGTLDVTGKTLKNPTGLAIGTEFTNYYQGYIDEFRVSKGIARWTEDFTPPVSEYEPTPIEPIASNPFEGAFILTSTGATLIDPVQSFVVEPFNGTFALSSAGVTLIDPIQQVLLEPLAGTFTLNSAGAQLFTPYYITGEPLTGTFALSADVRLIQRTLFNGSLTLTNSLYVGSTINIVNSLNSQLSSNLSLVMNITQALSGNLTLKMNINERAEFIGTLNLLNNLLSADSGITHGEYYFLRSHGL